MRVVVNAIATLGILNEKGFELDIQSSKSIEIGNIVLDKNKEINEKEIPGYNDMI